MRQKPLQLVALAVCLNGMLFSVVLGENERQPREAFAGRPIEQPLDLLKLVVRHLMKKVFLQIHRRNLQVVNLPLLYRMQ